MIETLKRILCEMRARWFRGGRELRATARNFLRIDDSGYESQNPAVCLDFSAEFGQR